MANYRLLFKEIRSNFNATELDELCFELGYDPGQVFSQPGNLSRMAQDLQEYARRRGQEQELMQAIADTRDNIDLTPYGYVAPSGSSTSAASERSSGSLVQPQQGQASKVYISYKWNDPSEDFVNELVPELRDSGIDVIRDKDDLGFKGLIREFMQEIGQGNTVIIVISDGYLRSKNCMYELMQVYERSKYGGDSFYDRVIPIVMSDAKIYDAIDRLDYLDYWSEKQEVLEERARRAKGLQNINSITEEINLYDQIRDTIDHLMDMLGNMNTLTADMHRDSSFQEAKDAIRARLQ